MDLLPLDTQLLFGQPTLAINKIVNEKGTGKTSIEFQGHSHSTQLTTGQTYSIEWKSDHFSNTPIQWAVNAVDNNPPNSGYFVYYKDNKPDRTLVFQNFQSNMVGNYTCTLISGSRTLEITEGQFSNWSYYGLSYSCVRKINLGYRQYSY